MGNREDCLSVIIEGHALSYPIVLDEFTTLERCLGGHSLTRVGEGELRLAAGNSIKCQAYDARLAHEMQALMLKPCPALVCLPRIWEGMPAERFWRQFEEPRYSRFYGFKTYGSAFISRPDMVHAIDTPAYWERASSLWRGRDVVLVARGNKVISLDSATSVVAIKCPPTDAYSEIARIEEEIGQPNVPILLAAGPTATVLAARLARKGLFAIDIGHLGKFINSAGAYSMERQALISDYYIKQNQALHRRPEGYGGSGHKLKDVVFAYASELDAEMILDYGCGQGTLKKALKQMGFLPDVLEYDPAIKGKNGLPKPADLVVCTDVLEHVEPDKLTAVLEHLYRLTIKGAFFMVALRTANKTLPDGRNAHLTVADTDFWLTHVKNVGYVVTKEETKIGHDVKLWLRK